MRIRDIGKAIGDFDLNNIPKLIAALIALTAWGVYLVAKLVIKLWYVYFGILLTVYYRGYVEIAPFDEIDVGYYTEHYYHVFWEIYIYKDTVIMPIIGTAIYFIIRYIVRKTAHFFEQ